MLDQVSAAFDRQDYKTAAHLLKQLHQQSPDNLWVRLYIGRLREVTGKAEAAEAIYRGLLQGATPTKVAAQAREGLQRLAAAAQSQREAAIAQAMADPSQTAQGVLVLEPIDASAKQAAAQSFARIMKIDAYAARLLLPSRGWRLYRVGAIGELQVLGQALRQAGIPVFWVSLADLQQIRVFRVQYIQSALPQPQIVCLNESDQLGSLTFEWSEVSRRVNGLLPIFEDVVDVVSHAPFQRQALTHREETQDYAQVLDLHLPKRRCLLRFCDRAYQFNQGVVFDASQDGAVSQATTRIRWNQLAAFLGDRVHGAAPLGNATPHQSSGSAGSEFTPFAETALEQLAIVRNFPAHIDVFRKQPSAWDAAFHLYSTLIFQHTA
ncbi:tetratricopeptide repeat protein [Phormidium tenue FACHB-886]|nr:tetratricopeptide repeat protein [Phormidium tenue FACHB-886]